MYVPIKRFLDFIISLTLIFMLSPILVLISICIKITSPGPAIFKQIRLGKNGANFTIYKFRTMVLDAEQMGTGLWSFDDDPRVTRIGRLLRKTSLDELPQLLNIFKGDMSFIGPRPPVTYYPYPFEEYTSRQKKRFSVLPGVTGLAQISGRKEISWPDRIELDIEYVESISFLLDFKILMKTIFVVFQTEGTFNVVSSDTQQTTRKDM